MPPFPSFVMATWPTLECKISTSKDNRSFKYGYIQVWMPIDIFINTSGGQTQHYEQDSISKQTRGSKTPGKIINCKHFKPKILIN